MQRQHSPVALPCGPLACWRRLSPAMQHAQPPPHLEECVVVVVFAHIVQVVVLAAGTDALRGREGSWRAGQAGGGQASTAPPDRSGEGQPSRRRLGRGRHAAASPLQG